MAFVQSSGWNVLIAWVRIDSSSARVNSGDRVIPRWAWMIPSPAPTSVIQSKDRVSGEMIDAGTNRRNAGWRCQEYGTSFQRIDSPKR